MSVRISYGVNDVNLDRAGQTVGQVRTELAQVLGLPSSGVAARLNGSDATDSTVLRDEDELEFVKPSSTRGQAA